MPLFRPNLDCKIAKRTGTNVYGEETLGAPKAARCAIIELKLTVDRSSVRADSSASRGSAQEYQGTAKMLFPATIDLARDDQVQVLTHKLRVVSIFPRHSLNGVLDHYEVELTVWGKT